LKLRHCFSMNIFLAIFDLSNIPLQLQELYSSKDIHVEILTFLEYHCQSTCKDNISNRLSNVCIGYFLNA